MVQEACRKEISDQIRKKARKEGGGRCKFIKESNSENRQEKLVSEPRRVDGTLVGHSLTVQGRK